MATLTTISDDREAKKTTFWNLQIGDNFIIKDEKTLFKRINIIKSLHENAIDLKTGELVYIDIATVVTPVDIHIRITADKAAIPF